MAVEIRYICDKCGHIQSTDVQMWGIGVALRWNNAPFGDSDVQRKALWCRSCVEGIGLLVSKPSSGAQPTSPEPTLEDMIREIIRSEVGGS